MNFFMYENWNSWDSGQISQNLHLKLYLNSSPFILDLVKNKFGGKLCMFSNRVSKL